MGYSILRSILRSIVANLFNLILLVIFFIVVYTVLTFVLGAQAYHGFLDPVNNPVALRLVMYTFLAAMMLSGIGSGFLSRHFLRTPPAVAGFQSCAVIPMVILVNHLHTPPLAPGEPSHGVYIYCCIMTMLFGSVSAVLRARSTPR